MVQLKVDTVGDPYLLEEDGEIYIYKGKAYYAVGSCFVSPNEVVLVKDFYLTLTDEGKYLKNEEDYPYEEVPVLWRDRTIWLQELLKWSS